ncbi:UDP-N-acetylglucosamine--N-acetylmuramyl-(pentapeptide) pyrophosphoryl-undecaprenol N-acetylglucosamine transferase [Candidatus Jorgensenbacteria bacterium]|nr:UDP-N-acetylglucosamine--N-acetylmuramyl-(pentapeptide) pyrophosphoryl-undecaprenol N-acetylglucosamine transferase [Candidatus Jorgensenbacteria bacterium]
MIRIVLTGGGSGGHMFPLVAVVGEIKTLSHDAPELIYLGASSPFLPQLKASGVVIRTIVSSKFRRYFDFRNVIDIPKFFISLFQALIELYFIMPDVVFSKGGPGALAVILAARFYLIPVIIHESDTVPGLTNRLSAYFAERIGIAFRSAATYFPSSKTAFVGNPVRKELTKGLIGKVEAKERLGFGPNDALLLVLTGSQGSTRINTFIFDNIELLLADVQIYHQVGGNNIKEAEQVLSLLRASPGVHSDRYHIAGHLTVEEMASVLSAADIIISRAGAGAIYEIAASGKPAILIPLDESANDHQRQNAYEYAKSGAGTVIEEANFRVNLVLNQIHEFIDDKDKLAAIENSAKQFFKPDAALTLAREILFLAKYVTEPLKTA